MPIYYLINQDGQPVNKIIYNGESSYVPPNGLTLAIASQELEAQAQALREAEEQARLAEESAKKEAVIQSFMSDGLPRSVAEHYYNAIPKS
jgi:hypothetical protein